MMGRRVGEWVLERKIGEGGFAEVWLAHHSVFEERKAAVKLPTDNGYRDYLRREGVVQERLQHENIVQILGADMDTNPPYLVMEYMEGGSLRQRLKDAPLQPQQAKRLMQNLLSALQFAHEKGIIHCDIKPENILFDRNGVAKLSDFGMWRYKAELARSGRLSLTLATKDEPRGGTALYMSPEQQQGEEPDASDDLWALGIVLFECLTGRLPAPGDRISDFVAAPQWAERLFSRCFVRRQKRAKTAAELLSLLQDEPKRVVVRRPEVVEASRDVVPREGGCAPVFFAALFGLVGLVAGFVFGPLGHIEGAVAGAIVGMVVGANLLRPIALMVVVASTVGGAMLLRHPLGAMLGAVLSMAIFSFLTAKRQSA